MTRMPRPHDLPGTDPRFHEHRKYLSVMKVQGVERIVSNGSCKHDGCGYSAAWATNAGRDRGMWQHRAYLVVEARIQYFKTKFQGDTKKMTRALIETVDCHTHLFAHWMKQVDEFILELAEVKSTDLPDFNFRVEYDLGSSAYDVAQAAIEKASSF